MRLPGAPPVGRPAPDRDTSPLPGKRVPFRKVLAQNDCKKFRKVHDGSGRHPPPRLRDGGRRTEPTAPIEGVTMRTTAFRVSRRPAGRGRLRPTALPIAVVTVFAALFGAAAPAAALDPAPASAPGQTVPTTAPGCVHLYAGLRYTHLHSECEEEHLLRVRYTFGEVSDCRLVVPGGWHTFRGYGFDGDHPVAVEPCAD
ncbi:hypothetical protein FNQ90_15860 [Streptomyces alkaliphilus]|uniref:Alpha-amylase n=2 Tax=Streptomyces alkaliphilus TaxID=1472722 RepID=A0A7W3TF22_9ACTN|nr:hypothetical protein [Streptomyces alkaliphilus]